VRLKQSQRRTVVLKLSSSAQRLLTQKHRLAARLSVSGTLIGVLKASLASAAFTLRDPPKRQASTPPTHKR
jgi:hypothetical protein